MKEEMIIEKVSKQNPFRVEQDGTGYLEGINSSLVVNIFHYEGIRNINFITKNKDYQWFVDKVNDYKSPACESWVQSGLSHLPDLFPCLGRSSQLCLNSCS